MTETQSPPRHQRLGLALGPAAALAILALMQASDLAWPAQATAAMAVLMAVWWASEAVPVPVTALLPLVLLPILGVQSFRDAASAYAHPTVYLFLGGFILALTVERCGLHRRIALFVFSKLGRGARSLAAGFMGTAAAISMWMSNTSTTLMLLPIALSVVTLVRETVTGLTDKERSNFAAVVLLGLAYGATIGGMATLVGTPPNALMAGYLSDTFSMEIDFARWMLVGLPVTLVMLPMAWLVLTRIVFPVGFTVTPQVRGHIDTLWADLGPMSTAEKRTAAIFLALVAGWMLRGPLTDLTGLTMISDSVIAMVAAILVFIVPAGGVSREPLLTWPDTAKLPWGVLILFGGGLSLAGAVTASGLGLWLGEQLAGLADVHIGVLVLAATLLVIFLTELTSNLATTATFLPVVGALAATTDQDPLVFVVPVALAASCAFMFPVATPPNAIVYSSGQVSIPQMVRAGVLLNLFGVVVLSFIALVWAPMVF